MYVAHLSRALADLGHAVTVYAGPPYPELPDEVVLRRVPSLDLYRPHDPFRRPRRNEFRSPVDVLEYALMCTGAFPEPLTFSLRVRAALRRSAARHDVIHDNQCLGYGLLGLAVPLVATIHHPISVDRRLALARAEGWTRRIGQRRWYSFVRMQRRVARRLAGIITPSEVSAADIARDFAVDPRRISVVPNGVDPDVFRPLPEVARVPGRIVTVASSDLPSKGLEVLVEAIAKLATERDVELVVIGRGGKGEAFRRAVARFGLQARVRAAGRVEPLEMVRLYAEAEAAVIPSLYEGFSLPAAEAMACGVPLVATDGGALSEVVGDAALVVPRGDAGALAAALASMLDSPVAATARGSLGRARVIERFTWRSTAEETLHRYRQAIARC